MSITNENLLQTLSNLSITKYSASKRLQKECELLLHHNVIISAIYCDDAKNIIVECIKNDNLFVFCLAPDYPFRPPRIIVNGQTTDDLINIYHNKTKCIEHAKCVACASFLCITNWSPIIQMHHIVKQIEEIM